MWLGGNAPSADDKVEYAGLKSAPDAESYPATFAWYVNVQRFSDAVRNSWAGAKKADDDMDDLFGDEDAEPAPKKV